MTWLTPAMPSNGYRSHWYGPHERASAQHEASPTQATVGIALGREGGPMINIAALNSQLVEQDEALRARFTQITSRVTDDDAMRALAELIGEGLAAIHERQGNMITLMLRTNT